MSLRVRLLPLFLLLLVLSHHAESGSIVKFLPGFEGPLPFQLETGYIGVGEQEEVQLFYYFIKSEKNPKEDPLILWLDGGPGCSAIYGLFLENGPLAIKFEVYNGSVPSLISTTFSWTKMASILYLEQPVGTGFSYAKSSLIDRPSDTGEVRRIHEFVQKWLSENPQFYSNPFYVGGTSYSGMIVPALVHEISNGNYICCKPLVNLQGYILGNPITHIKIGQNYRIPFAHGMALIPDELYEKMKRACKGNYLNVDPLNIECGKLREIYLNLTTRIYPNHILIPDCDMSSPDCYLYRYFLLDKWANKESVREALHVNKGTIVEWVRCNGTIGKVYDFDIKSSVPYHKNNSINGYRSLIFSGDHDMAVPFMGTQAWIRSLNYSISDDWRPWMINDQIAGYTRSYANKMTYATVKGGGHTPEYKPYESFIMFQRWISGKPL